MLGLYKFRMVCYLEGYFIFFVNLFKIYYASLNKLIILGKLISDDGARAGDSQVESL